MIAIVRLLLVPAMVYPSFSTYPASGYLFGRGVSWSRDFVVEGGRSVAISGKLYSENIQLSGNFTVRSCCGLTSNDIVFYIMGRDFLGSRNYGTVVDELTFEWNTGKDEKFSLFFDNSWGRVCESGRPCRPDPSHPSSHNKTIQLTVREVAPAELLDATLYYRALPLILIAGTGYAGFFGILALALWYDERATRRRNREYLKARGRRSASSKEGS